MKHENQTTNGKLYFKMKTRLEMLHLNLKFEEEKKRKWRVTT